MARFKSTHLIPTLIDGVEYYLPEKNQFYKEAPVLKTPDKGDWYIYFSVWDYNKGGWIPVKDYTRTLNKSELIKKKNERLAAGKVLTARALTFLQQGINPKTKTSLSPDGKSKEQLVAEAQDTSPVPLLTTAIAEWLLIKSGKEGVGKAPAENKENTAMNYTAFFTKFEVYCKREGIDTIKLHRIPKFKVEQFFEERYRGIKNKDGVVKRIGDSTWNVQLGWIKAMFNHYSKKYDYVDTIKNIPDKDAIDDSERFEPFTPDQVTAIFNHLENTYEVKRFRYIETFQPDKMLSLICRTIYYSFLRPSEIRRIKIKHVKNYEKGVLNLSVDITKTKKRVFNDLFLDPVLVAEFKKLEWEKYFKDSKYDNYYVFTTDLVPSAIKTNTYSFSKKFRAVLERLKIYKEDSRYSLYSFKATGNIAAYNSGWDLMQISIQNRHTTTGQTETYLRKLKIDIASKARPVRSVV